MVTAQKEAIQPIVPVPIFTWVTLKFLPFSIALQIFPHRIFIQLPLEEHNRNCRLRTSRQCSPDSNHPKKLFFVRFLIYFPIRIGSSSPSKKIVSHVSSLFVILHWVSPPFSLLHRRSNLFSLMNIPWFLWDLTVHTTPFHASMFWLQNTLGNHRPQIMAHKSRSLFFCSLSWSTSQKRDITRTFMN